ncbi:amino acid ABC transporter permease [Shinella zoogloeoides]|uniref:amino acid ABC transporter permease n=1 Tax=Shinella zoogloeoides TaxID=352475 RepID=UPI0028A6B3E8|nr:amino acid ABC transporter permease [Shinella zoogloeoides]
MDYIFQFGAILDSLPRLLAGAKLTVMLTVATMLGGVVIGILGAIGRMFGPPPIRAALTVYVETIRNTPFLIQLFLIYFGLPSLGIVLSPTWAALIGMTVNCGAYAIEIIRSGIVSIPPSHLEAGRALAFRTRDIIRHVVLFPAMRVALPALGSQFVLVMLGSSVVSTIATEELTAVGHLLETETFRPFEVYIVVTILYVAIAFTMKAMFAGIGHFYFNRRGGL